MAPPTFSQPLPKSHIQKVGTKLELEVTCATNEKGAKFSWKKPIYASDDPDHVKFVSGKKSSKCIISAVQIQDEGDWSCELETPKGKTESLCSLVVYVPKCYRIPVFLEELQAKESLNGTVALECKVIGVPTPILRWFKDNQELQSGDLYELKVERGVHTVYKCVAVNCVGSAASEAILKTTQKNIQPPSIITELKDVRAKIGTKVQLDVIAHEKSAPCISKWTHKGTEVIETKGKYELSQGEPNHFSLVIVKADLEDDGEWNVCISNSMGKVEDKCILTLKVPKNYRKPMFVENLKAHLTDEGMVSFECKVVGFPTPSLTWLKDGRLLTPGDVYELYGNQSIGVYTCVAKNCMGTETSTSTLTIEDLQKKPKDPVVFISPLVDQKIPYGGSYQIFAQVSSKLQLPFSWKRNGTAVNFPEYVIGCEEDGKYFCNIVNATVKDEGLWELTIEDNGEVLSSSCNIQVPIPQHFKAPKFLDNLRIHLTESGTVSLECKVIGIPQPKLRWFKDDKELQAGDLHKLVHDKNLKDNACIFGVYKCVAYNCMGETSSSAKLIGFDTDEDLQPSDEKIPETKIPTEDSFDEIDVSSSFGGKSVALSMSDVPDLSSENAQQIVEMFANELEPQIVNDIVELPPLRFVRETSKASNISIEAVVIDIDEQSLLELETSRMSLENIDDLNTEADLDDISEDSGHSINTIQHFEIEELEEAAAAEKAKAEREHEIREKTPTGEDDIAAHREQDKDQNMRLEKQKNDGIREAQKRDEDPKDTTVDAIEAKSAAKTEEKNKNRTPQDQVTKQAQKDQKKIQGEAKEIKEESIIGKSHEDHMEVGEGEAVKQIKQNERQGTQEVSHEELNVMSKEIRQKKDQESIIDAEEDFDNTALKTTSEEVPKKSTPKAQTEVQIDISQETIEGSMGKDEREVAQMSTPSQTELDKKGQKQSEKETELESKPMIVEQTQDTSGEKKNDNVTEVTRERSTKQQDNQDNLTDAEILKLSGEIESVATKLQKEDRQRAAEELSASNPNYFKMVLEHKSEFQVDEQEKEPERYNREEGEELDEEVEQYLERRRRSNSYEDTIKNLDPELLKELGLDSNGDQLEVPTKETNKNIASRVDEMANQLVKDTAPSHRRSRSRSRSRSRPPNLDTVEENYSQELQEALYYGRQRSNLEDIKECPSCSSVQSMESQIDRSKSIPHNHPVPEESQRGAQMSIDMDMQFDLNRSENDKTQVASEMKNINTTNEAMSNNGEDSSPPMLEEIPSSELEQLAASPINEQLFETKHGTASEIGLSSPSHRTKDYSEAIDLNDQNRLQSIAAPQDQLHNLLHQTEEAMVVGNTFLTEVTEEPDQIDEITRQAHETIDIPRDCQTVKQQQEPSQPNTTQSSTKSSSTSSTTEGHFKDEGQDKSEKGKNRGSLRELDELEADTPSNQLIHETQAQEEHSNEPPHASKNFNYITKDEQLPNQSLDEQNQCNQGQAKGQNEPGIPLDSTTSGSEPAAQSLNSKHISVSSSPSEKAEQIKQSAQDHEQSNEGQQQEQECLPKDSKEFDFESERVAELLQKEEPATKGEQDLIHNNQNQDQTVEVSSMVSETESNAKTLTPKSRMAKSAELTGVQSSSGENLSLEQSPAMESQQVVSAQSSNQAEQPSTKEKQPSQISQDTESGQKGDQGLEKNNQKPQQPDQVQHHLDYVTPQDDKSSTSELGRKGTDSKDISEKNVEKLEVKSAQSTASKRTEDSPEDALVSMKGDESSTKGEQDVKRANQGQKQARNVSEKTSDMPVSGTDTHSNDNRMNKTQSDADELDSGKAPQSTDSKQKPEASQEVLDNEEPSLLKIDQSSHRATPSEKDSNQESQDSKAPTKEGDKSKLKDNQDSKQINENQVQDTNDPQTEIQAGLKQKPRSLQDANQVKMDDQCEKKKKRKAESNQNQDPIITNSSMHSEKIREIGSDRNEEKTANEGTNQNLDQVTEIQRQSMEKPATNSIKLAPETTAQDTDSKPTSNLSQGTELAMVDEQRPQQKEKSQAKLHPVQGKTVMESSPDLAKSTLEIATQSTDSNQTSNLANKADFSRTEEQSQQQTIPDQSPSTQDQGKSAKDSILDATNSSSEATSKSTDSKQTSLLLQEEGLSAEEQVPQETIFDQSQLKQVQSKSLEPSGLDSAASAPETATERPDSKQTPEMSEELSRTEKQSPQQTISNQNQSNQVQGKATTVPDLNLTEPSEKPLDGSDSTQNTEAFNEQDFGRSREQNAMQIIPSDSQPKQVHGQTIESMTLDLTQSTSDVPPHSTDITQTPEVLQTRKTMQNYQELDTSKQISGATKEILASESDKATSERAPQSTDSEPTPEMNLLTSDKKRTLQSDQAPKSNQKMVTKNVDTPTLDSVESASEKTPQIADSKQISQLDRAEELSKTEEQGLQKDIPDQSQSKAIQGEGANVPIVDPAISSSEATPKSTDSKQTSELLQKEELAKMEQSKKETISDQTYSNATQSEDKEDPIVDPVKSSSETTPKSTDSKQTSELAQKEELAKIEQSKQTISDQKSQSKAIQGEGANVPIVDPVIFSSETTPKGTDSKQTSELPQKEEFSRTEEASSSQQNSSSPSQSQPTHGKPSEVPDLDARKSSSEVSSHNANSKQPSKVTKGDNDLTIEQSALQSDPILEKSKQILETPSEVSASNTIFGHAIIQSAPEIEPQCTNVEERELTRSSYDVKLQNDKVSDQIRQIPVEDKVAPKTNSSESESGHKKRSPLVSVNEDENQEPVIERAVQNTDSKSKLMGAQEAKVAKKGDQSSSQNSQAQYPEEQDQDEKGLLSNSTGSSSEAPNHEKKDSEQELQGSTEKFAQSTTKDSQNMNQAKQSQDLAETQTDSMQNTMEDTSPGLDTKQTFPSLHDATSATKDASEVQSENKKAPIASKASKPSTQKNQEEHVQENQNSNLPHERGLKEARSNATKSDSETNELTPEPQFVSEMGNQIMDSSPQNNKTVGASSIPTDVEPEQEPLQNSSETSPKRSTEVLEENISTKASLGSGKLLPLGSDSSEPSLTSQKPGSAPTDGDARSEKNNLLQSSERLPEMETDAHLQNVAMEDVHKISSPDNSHKDVAPDMKLSKESNDQENALKTSSAQYSSTSQPSLPSQVEGQKVNESQYEINQSTSTTAPNGISSKSVPQALGLENMQEKSQIYPDYTSAEDLSAIGPGSQKEPTLIPVIKKKDANRNTYLHPNSQSNGSSKTEVEPLEVTMLGGSSNSSQSVSETKVLDPQSRESGAENESEVQRRVRAKRSSKQKTPEEESSSRNVLEKKAVPKSVSQQDEASSSQASKIPADNIDARHPSSKTSEDKALDQKGDESVGLRSHEKLDLKVQHNERDVPCMDDDSSVSLSFPRKEEPRLTLAQRKANKAKESPRIDDSETSTSPSTRTIRPYTGEAKVSRSDERKNIQDQDSVPLVEKEPQRPVRKFQRKERNEVSSVIVSDNTLRLRSVDSQDPPEALTINVKEIGHDWVSLTWKKPYSSGGSVIVSYKVEAWLCGEGAYWMELGRTPITQYDVFNLKPKRQYYFRVTAKSKRGVELQMMTKGKVDLAKSTKKPEFTQKPTTLVRALKGNSLVLECEFFGEPPPTVTWTHSSMGTLPSESRTDGNQQTSKIELKQPQSGRVTCQITNEAGSASSATVIDVMENHQLYELYLKFYRFLHSPPSERIVVKEPIPPFFVAPPRDKRAKYGYPVQVRCLVGGDPMPRLSWYKQGTLIKDEVPDSPSDDTMLEIDDVNDSTIGEYEVCAENTFGKCVSRFVLIADGGLEEHIQPKFMVPLSAEVYSKTKALVLRTKISASPYVVINWYWNGSKVQPSPTNKKYFDHNGNATLSLTDHVCQGQYTCTASNEAGTVSTSKTFYPDDFEDHGMVVFEEPPQISVTDSKMQISCTLKQRGEVSLSTIPKVDGRHKKTFKKVDGNRYKVDINSDEEHLMGRVLYLIVRQGVNGYVVPINTSASTSTHFTCQFDQGPEDTNAQETNCDNQLVLSSDAFCRVGDDLTATLGHVPKGRLKIELDHDSKIAFRPKFNRNNEGKLEVTVSNATKDFEGTYKFKATTGDARTLQFHLNLVIMEKRDTEDTHSLDNPSFDSATPHPSNHMARLGGLTPRSTPRCSPFQSPRSTPARSLRSTPSRCETPADEDEDSLRRPHRPRSRLYPKFLSSLNDRCVVPGTDVELKCYVLSVPGLKTSWMKDGKEIVGNSTAIESRGMRSLTLSNVSPSDSGVYTVRMEDTQEMTDISSTCRIEVKERTPMSRYDGMSSSTRSSLSRSRPNAYSSGSTLGLPYQSAHQSVYRNNYQSSYLSSGYRRSYW